MKYKSIALAGLLLASNALGQAYAGSYKELMEAIRNHPKTEKERGKGADMSLELIAEQGLSIKIVNNTLGSYGMRISEPSLRGYEIVINEHSCTTHVFKYKVLGELLDACNSIPFQTIRVSIDMQGNYAQGILEQTEKGSKHLLKDESQALRVVSRARTMIIEDATKRLKRSPNS